MIYVVHVVFHGVSIVVNAVTTVFVVVDARNLHLSLVKIWSVIADILLFWCCYCYFVFVFLLLLQYWEIGNIGKSKRYRD